MFQVSDLGPKFCEIRDVTALSSNNYQENIEVLRETKNPETEADSSSDQSCSVTHHVTASSLHTDAMYLSQDFTSSYGLRRKCRKIVVTDEGERSWALDLRCRDSASPNQNRFVTLTLTHDSLINSRLYLPLAFLRENGMTKPGIVALLGKDGTRSVANLLKESSGRMSLGKGFKDFSKANGLKTGESFTLELTWENAAPVLGLFSNIESRSQNRFVTLTLTHDSLRKCRQGLPLSFMRRNGMTKPGKITLLGKDGTKWLANLLRESKGRMSLGKGWKEFAEGNGLEIGESFTFESIWKDATPMLSLLSKECESDGTQQGEYTIQKAS